MTPCARAANNQWKLGEELVDELSQTSFRRALQLAKGTVSILDRNGIVFKRVWCCYEVRLAVHSSDVADSCLATRSCVWSVRVHRRSTLP